MTISIEIWLSFDDRLSREVCGCFLKYADLDVDWIGDEADGETSIFQANKCVDG